MTMSANQDLGKRNNGDSTMYVDTLHVGDTDYTITGGIDVATADFTPVDSDGEPVYMHGLLISDGSGLIEVVLEGGGIMAPTFATNSSDSKKVLEGVRIKTIRNVNDYNTSFTGEIFPIW